MKKTILEVFHVVNFFKADEGVTLLGKLRVPIFEVLFKMFRKKAYLLSKF